MNKTVVLLVALISVLLAAWAALSVVGQKTQPPNQAPPSNSMPMAPNALDAPGQSDSAQKLTRTDQGEGNVNISATYMDKEDEIVFLVAVNTHSVDLSPLKLEELSVLKDAAGNEHEPAGWEESEAGGGHHRGGYLKFKRAGDDGRDITAGSGSMTLIVKDVAGTAERRLVWDLPIEPGGK